MQDEQDEPGTPLPEEFTDLADLRERLKKAGMLITDAMEAKERETEQQETQAEEINDFLTRVTPKEEPIVIPSFRIKTGRLE